jgi:hypothetical protein
MATPHVFNVRPNGDLLVVCDAISGTPWFHIQVFGGYQSLQISGDFLTILVNGGGVEVYNLGARTRVR